MVSWIVRVSRNHIMLFVEKVFVTPLCLNDHVYSNTETQHNNWMYTGNIFLFHLSDLAVQHPVLRLWCYQSFAGWVLGTCSSELSVRLWDCLLENNASLYSSQKYTKIWFFSNTNKLRSVAPQSLCLLFLPKHILAWPRSLYSAATDSCLLLDFQLISAGQCEDWQRRIL